MTLRRTSPALFALMASAAPSVLQAEALAAEAQALFYPQSPNPTVRWIAREGGEHLSLCKGRAFGIDRGFTAEHYQLTWSWFNKAEAVFASGRKGNPGESVLKLGVAQAMARREAGMTPMLQILDTGFSVDAITERCSWLVAFPAWFQFPPRRGE